MVATKRVSFFLSIKAYLKGKERSGTLFKCLVVLALEH